MGEHASTPQSGVEASRLLKTEPPQIVLLLLLLWRSFLGGCFFVGRCHVFVVGASVEGGVVVCCCWWRFVVVVGLFDCFGEVEWRLHDNDEVCGTKGEPNFPNRAPKFAHHFCACTYS